MKKVLYFISGVLIFLSLFYSSCRNAEKLNRLQQLDSLNHSLNQLEELVSDLEGNDFQQRLDSIRLKLKVLHESGKDSSTPDLKNAVITYSAIASNYDKYADEEPVIVYEASKHIRIFEELKTKTDSGEQQEFDDLLQNEQRSVKLLYAKTADLGYRMVSVEKDYERASAVINPIFHSSEK